MKKILVPVDFSEASRNASVYAIEFAKAFNAEIVLLHALFIPNPVGDFPGYIPLSLTDMLQDNEALLQGEIESLSKNTDLRIDGYVRMGTATVIINDMVDEIKPDIIIMGMKGAGKTGGIFGSTVTSCTRKAPLPVLVIPENEKYSPVKSICFASDFGKWPSLSSYKTLAQIVNQSKAMLNIVHVAKDNEHMGAEKISGKIKADLLFDKIDHRFHTVVNADVAKGLHDFVSENPIDMLVMVAHQHNLFERLFGTVHTKDMTYQANKPLLVLHD